MSALRVAFVLQNAAFFKKITFSLYLFGIYFDSVTLALLALPTLIFYNPFLIKLPKAFQHFLLSVTKFYLFCIAIVVLVLNSWDIAYFSYAQKRSGFSYFVHILTGTESSSLAGEFLSEFWWILPLFAALLFPIISQIRRIESFSYEQKINKWLLFRFLILMVFLVILGRGGLQLRPVSIIDATAKSSLELAPIVLNTAFTVIKTIDNNQTKLINLHSDIDLNKLLPERSVCNDIPVLPESTNVVLLILESFGSNYVGPTAPTSYAPFLDSLFSKSLFFEYAISNGRTSMDAVPAILAGMPSWLPESYILSPFCGNQLNSLPQILKQKGYNTSFYHGAKEGSMNFKSFTKAIDIDQYIGLESYPNAAHFDGNWGVWDHKMLPYFARELTRKKQPFFSSIFTLSSHHPYQIPENFKSKLKEGAEPLCRSISYTDSSLALFFKLAKRQKWFSNTLFVITADHVGPTRQQQFQTLDWRYHIPIAFYHPTISLPKAKNGFVFQQIDIMPTVLDLLGFVKPKFQLGSSYFERNQSQKMAYDNGSLLSFIYNGSKLVPIAWTPGFKRKYTVEQNKIGKRTSAMYQYYINSLIQNRCSNRTLR